MQAAIFSQEQSRFDVPGSVFAQGIGMAGPALMAHGDDAQIMHTRGAAGMVAGEDPNAAHLDSLFLGQWSSRFGGGTEQVQRNIIGERILGLPREPTRS